MKRCWSVALAACILAVSSGAATDVCQQAAPDSLTLGRSFKLTVLDSAKAPRPGIKVSLGTIDHYNVMHPTATGVTDQNGVLNFVKVQSGDYILQMVDSTTEQHRRPVRIVSAGGDTAFEFSWPYVNWLQLRSASGFLMYYAEPMRRWNVTLLGFPEGAELGYTNTDNLGRFDIPTNAGGRYWLDISQNDSATGLKKSIGKVPVNVTQDNKYPAQDAIFVASTSCGMKYDQYCTYPAEKLKALCLQVVDAKGTPVAATANLASMTGSSTTKFSTDKDGYFKLPSSVGDFDLTIFAKDFTPVRQRITLTPTDSSCTTAIVIPMYPFGSGCVARPQGKGN